MHVGVEQMGQPDCTFFTTTLVLVATCILLAIGVPAWTSDRNTCGVAAFHTISEEAFNLCFANISFMTTKAEEVSARVWVPCVASFNTTEIDMDICYNWVHPDNVAYDSKMEGRACGVTGPKAAKKLIVAGVLLPGIHFAILSLCYVTRPRKNRKAVGDDSQASLEPAQPALGQGAASPV